MQSSASQAFPIAARAAAFGDTCRWRIPPSQDHTSADTGEDLRQTLRILGSTASSELMALEVIWQPEGRGDVLSANDLVTAYPNLQHL